VFSLSPRRKRIRFDEVFKRVMSIDEGDVYEANLMEFMITGEPPDLDFDPDLDPQGYRESVKEWNARVDSWLNEKMKRQEAAYKAWETRRKRYGESGRRKKH